MSLKTTDKSGPRDRINQPSTKTCKKAKHMCAFVYVYLLKTVSGTTWERLTANSSKIFLSSSCPHLSAIHAGSEPSLFFIWDAHVAPEHWSKWIASLFKPNFAAQWRRVGSCSKWVSVSTEIQK